MATRLDPALTPEELERQAYGKAIKLLAAREHSAHELRSKLSQRGFEQVTIDATLHKVSALGYQCDQRFANTYAEQLFNKHFGPRSIQAKLAERGIDSSLVSDALDAVMEGVDGGWEYVAAKALINKFDAAQLADPDQRQRGKVARFLANRGFSSTVSLRSIRLAIEMHSQN